MCAFTGNECKKWGVALRGGVDCHRTDGAVPVSGWLGKSRSFCVNESIHKPMYLDVTVCLSRDKRGCLDFEYKYMENGSSGV